MLRILIVEDEKPIADLLAMSLEEAGYRCDIAYDGMDAVLRLDRNSYELLLLDIMLPELDGYEVMDYAAPLSIPTILLTARAQTADKVRGLRAGADDYLAKPFEIDELLARIESVLRRSGKLKKGIRLGDLEIDTASRQVSRDGVALSLTPKEYELLLYLIQNKNIALYRDQIFEKIWGDEELGDSRTVDLHIQRLRKKTGIGCIESVYKVGYRLEVGDETVLEDIL